jgi:hypothetical protein
MMGKRLTYFSVDDAKRENIKLHGGRPMIETGGGGGRNNKWQKNKWQSTSAGVREKRGEMKIRKGK